MISLPRAGMDYVRSAICRHRVLQIAVLCLFSAIGEGLTRAFGLPIPGGVIGMALVFALLASGVVKLGTLRGGARWLLAEMLLFFVPMVLAVLNQRAYFGLLGLKILVVIVAGTAAVMMVTAFVVDFGFKKTGAPANV